MERIQSDRTRRSRNPWFDRPFDKPFDRLTVLSNVDGLTVLSKVEGLTVLSSVEGLTVLSSVEGLTTLSEVEGVSINLLHFLDSGHPPAADSGMTDAAGLPENSVFDSLLVTG